MWVCPLRDKETFSKFELQKVYLSVHYSKKAEAKAVKCLWDPEKKCWFCFSNNTEALEKFKRI